MKNQWALWFYFQIVLSVLTNWAQRLAQKKRQKAKVIGISFVSKSSQELLSPWFHYRCDLLTLILSEWRLLVASTKKKEKKARVSVGASNIVQKLRCCGMCLGMIPRRSRLFWFPTWGRRWRVIPRGFPPLQLFSRHKPPFNRPDPTWAPYKWTVLADDRPRGSRA